MSDRSDRPLPVVLYKYFSDERWANAFLERGAIRLGTLRGYPQTMGNAVGDPEEGTRKVLEGTAAVDVSDPRNRTPIMDQIMSFAGNNSRIVLDRVLMTEKVVHPDANIYCTSSLFNRRIWDAFNAVACVRIDQPRPFIVAMFEQLERDGIARGCAAGWCDYSGRVLSTSVDAPHPAFLKNPEYAYQSELRTLVIPTTPPTTTFLDVEIPGLVPFVSREERVPV